MEKFENMKQNMVSDDDLDQITGGKGVIDVFTTEFRGFRKKATTLELNNDDNDFTVSTLEMRTNPLDKQEKSKGRKTIKL